MSATGGRPCRHHRLVTRPTSGARVPPRPPRPSRRRSAHTRDTRKQRSSTGLLPERVVASELQRLSPAAVCWAPPSGRLKSASARRGVLQARRTRCEFAPPRGRLAWPPTRHQQLRADRPPRVALLRHRIPLRDRGAPARRRCCSCARRAAARPVGAWRPATSHVPRAFLPRVGGVREGGDDVRPSQARHGRGHPYGGARRLVRRDHVRTARPR